MTSKHKGKRAPTPARDYPPGFFTEPVRAWACLRWDGPLTMSAGGGGGRFTDLAQRGRRKATADGSGWGRGTVMMPGTPKQDAPAWMVRHPLG